MNRKLLSTLLTIVLFFNIASLFLVTDRAWAQTELKVLNPLTGDGNFAFMTDTTFVGDTFIANVTVFEAVGMTAWQVNVSWDPTLLDLLDITYPADHVFAGQSIFEGAKEINNTNGWVLWWVALGIGTTPVDVGTGGATLCQLEFEITDAPTTPGTYSCNLHLVLSGETTFFTKLEPSISFTAYDGLYSIEWAPPPPPYLSIEPSLKVLGGGAPIVGTPDALFSLDVYINNVDPGWRMVGVQWKITGINRTVVDVLGATEGPFMSSFAPDGTVWIFHDDFTELVFGIVINNFTDLTTFPSGSGLLATIDFEVILQNEFPWMEEFPVTIEPLLGEWAIDVELNYLEFSDPTSGLVRVLGYITGRNIDVYTQYGGEGPGTPGGAFWPQKTVILNASVTYNLDAVQSKIVTFEITSPTGLHHFVLTAVSGTDGVATVEFGLPWPCEDPEEEIFGIWNVTVSVDIACEVVTDFLQFKVWWRLDIYEVVPKATEFVKGDMACFDIFYRTYSDEPFWVLISLVVLDDLNVPVGSAYMWIEVGGEHEWCTFVEGNLTLCVYLPKWAFVGTGTVKVSALSDWPSEGGSGYCPEATATFSILRPE
jgi:hypothetical protein